MSCSTWISLEKLPLPSIGVSRVSSCARNLSSSRPCSSSRSASALTPCDSSRPRWSITRTASADKPGTDPATRLTTAATWLSASCRPRAIRTITDAVGGASSRTNTDLLASAKCTRTASTPSISSILSCNSCSRAARRCSPSIVRLAPSGRLSSAVVASGLASPPSAATSMRALYRSSWPTVSVPVWLSIV